MRGALTILGVLSAACIGAPVAHGAVAYLNPSAPGSYEPWVLHYDGGPAQDTVLADIGHYSATFTQQRIGHGPYCARSAIWQVTCRTVASFPETPPPIIREAIVQLGGGDDVAIFAPPTGVCDGIVNLACTDGAELLLLGDAGNDRIVLGGHTGVVYSGDDVYAGDGDDVIELLDGRSAFVSCGTGNDTVIVDGPVVAPVTGGTYASGDRIATNCERVVHVP